MFTDLTLQKFKASPGKRVEKWDSGQGGQKGLGIRIGKKKIFFFKYFFEGRKKRITIGEYPGISLAEARLMAQEALVLLQKGIDPGIEVHQEKQRYANEPTVEDLIKEFWDQKLSAQKSGKDSRRLLIKDILKPWGKRKVSTIKTRDIVLLLDTVAERARITRNRLHAAINGMFNFAISRGILETNPCANIAKLDERPRQRALDQAELSILWHSLDTENRKVFNVHPITQLAIKLLILTGQRIGNVVAMERSEIVKRPDGLWWEIPAEKMKGENAEDHDVPLNPMALSIIDNAKFYSGNSEFIFQSSRKKDCPMGERTINKALNRHLEEMELKKFTPHDLRRTCRTGLATLKVSDVVAEKIMAHRLQGMLRVYNRATYDPERREALFLWEEHIKQLIGPTKCDNSI